MKALNDLIPTPNDLTGMPGLVTAIDQAAR